MAKTNPRTGPAVVRHIKTRFPQDDLTVICYPDDDREGYYVKVTIDEPEGVVLPNSCSTYRDWFHASMTAVQLVPLVTRQVEIMLSKRAQVFAANAV